MKTQESDTKFVPVPADFFSTKTGRKLFRAGPIHQLRFLWLVFKAHGLGKNGQLKGSDNEPLDVDDLAEDHDRDFDGWKTTLKVCNELELIEILEDGTIKIVSPEYWTRPPSARPSAVRKRVQKHREKLSEDPEPKTEPEPCNDPVTDDNSSNSSLSKIRADQSRSEQEQIRSDLEKSRQDQEGLRPQSPLPACSFGQEEFFKDCDQAHRLLDGRAFPRSSRKNTLKVIEALPRSRFGWKDKAGAVLLAAQKVRWKIDKGEPVDNPWGLLLTIVSEHVKAAEQYNKLAERTGGEPEFHWSPEPVEVAS